MMKADLAANVGWKAYRFTCTDGGTCLAINFWLLKGACLFVIMVYINHFHEACTGPSTNQKPEVHFIATTCLADEPPCSTPFFNVPSFPPFLYIYSSSVAIDISGEHFSDAFSKIICGSRYGALHDMIFFHFR